MSRRASVFARQNPGKRRVRFPDEVIFENDVKEQDAHSVISVRDLKICPSIFVGNYRSNSKFQFFFNVDIFSPTQMLRRASVDIDINRINSAGQNLLRSISPTRSS